MKESINSQTKNPIIMITQINDITSNNQPEEYIPIQNKTTKSNPTGVPNKNLSNTASVMRFFII